ncbi:MAG: polysaccharide deacetylase family protein, partial [Lachnospiraceae bacterium]|nr:polysaccharide deacetylase family protein [Lachnospiraceae bacterium]
MKLVYSFDDGRADNMRVFDEILKPRSVPATINIATAYVDGSISPENRPCPNEAMGVDDVKRLAQSPLIELAGHGDQHLNTPEDLKKGLEKLRGWVSEDGTSLCSTDIAG